MIELQIIDLKIETDKSTIIFGKFNTPLLVMDAIIRKKISKDIEDLKNVQSPFSTYIYRTSTQHHQNTHLFKCT